MRIPWALMLLLAWPAPLLARVSPFASPDALPCSSDPSLCDDGNACTVDSCAPGDVCVHTPLLCSDLDACTDDACDPASGCLHTPVDCPADAVVCTDEVCDPAVGCIQVFHDERCPVWPNVCARNECRVEGCIPTATLEEICDDGNACTHRDRCNGSIDCTGMGYECWDGVDCTFDFCDPAIGCVFSPHDAFCNDGNACTVDLCDAASGCVITPVLAPDVGALAAQPDDETFFWAPAPTALAFDVARGTVGLWPVGSGTETCLVSHTGLWFVQDPDVPQGGGAFWYLVRARNQCGPGGWGLARDDGAPVPRVTGVCP